MPALAYVLPAETDVTETQPDVGLVAERYRLLSMIGRGGTGAVWRAEDLHLVRLVAIKQIVANEQRSTRSRARARREAQAVAQLRTPGVVQVYDVIDVGPYVYLVMEFVDAPSLARLVRRDGPLDPAGAAVAGRSILATLDAIHRAGVIHRDVKPSNILVDGDTLRLTDFGIALFGDDPTLTAAGSVLGTPAYMAPEQALGRRPGPQADLYGLGATLYFAVEGRAPFAESNSWETTQAVRTRPHRPGVKLGPLEPIIASLLVKDPRERPSVAEVDAALADVAGPVTLPGSVTVHSAPPAVAGTAPEPADPPAPPSAGGPVDDEKRQTRQLMLWVGLLLVLLVLALGLLFVAVREQPADAALSAAAVGPVIYHGRSAVGARPRSMSRNPTCNRSTQCGRSWSPVRSSRRS